MIKKKQDSFFNLSSSFTPAGDQPRAISKIVSSFKNESCKHHVLLGATGTGKTFSMANIIQQLNFLLNNSIIIIKYNLQYVQFN